MSSTAVTCTICNTATAKARVTRRDGSTDHACYDCIYHAEAPGLCHLPMLPASERRGTGGKDMRLSTRLSPLCCESEFNRSLPDAWRYCWGE